MIQPRQCFVLSTDSIRLHSTDICIKHSGAQALIPAPHQIACTRRLRIPCLYYAPMRRPIAARDAGWAKRTASFLARMGVRPNTVSCASVVFAFLAAFCMAATLYTESRFADAALFCAAALCIQGRLLCNLFDGMLAVEWNQASALGPIFNDFPDRPADVLILVGCGLCSGPPWTLPLGWLAAAMALLTAYTRVLGVAIGAGEYFIGPMAKQHRMAVATIACVVAAVEALAGWPSRVMPAVLILIALGCAFTIARRLKLIVRDLNETANAKINTTGPEASGE